MALLIQEVDRSTYVLMMNMLNRAAQKGCTSLVIQFIENGSYVLVLHYNNEFEISNEISDYNLTFVAYKLRELIDIRTPRKSIPTFGHIDMGLDGKDYSLTISFIPMPNANFLDLDKRPTVAVYFNWY